MKPDEYERARKLICQARDIDGDDECKLYGLCPIAWDLDEEET
nr:MAG TPA: hypothetical protein [Caudoviricetes sp.]